MPYDPLARMSYNRAFQLLLMSLVTVDGWVPAGKPLMLSRVGAKKTKKFHCAVAGTHTVLILVCFELKNSRGFVEVDMQRKVAVALRLQCKHTQSLLEETAQCDSSSPIASFVFSTLQEQCPTTLKVTCAGSKLPLFSSTRVYIRVLDGDPIRSETDLYSAAKRLAKDYPYLVRPACFFDGSEASHTISPRKPRESTEVLKAANEKSPLSEKAISENLARPFFLLATMHSALRCQLAKTLGISKLSSSPHEGAALLLFSGRKSIRGRAETITDKIFGKRTDWSLILRRALLQFQPILLRYFSVEALNARFHKGSVEAAVSVRQELRLEREFILRLADFVGEALKESGDGENIIARSAALVAQPPALLGSMFDALDSILVDESRKGTVPTWKVEDLVAVHELVAQLSLSSCSKTAEELRASREEDAETIVDTVNAQILWRRSPPNRHVFQFGGKAPGGKEKLMGLGRNIFIKKVVLAPLTPWLLKPLFLYQVASKVSGARSHLVFASVARVLTHRVFMGMLGLSVPE